MREILCSIILATSVLHLGRLMFAAFRGFGPLWIRPWSFPLPRFPPLLLSDEKLMQRTPVWRNLWRLQPELRRRFPSDNICCRRSSLYLPGHSTWSHARPESLPSLTHIINHHHHQNCYCRQWPKAQYTPPTPTRRNCFVASASAVWTQFATSSRRLPTDSVDNLETDQTDSIAFDYLHQFW